MNPPPFTLRDAVVLPVVALCLALPARRAAAWLWRLAGRLFPDRTRNTPSEE